MSREEPLYSFYWFHPVLVPSISFLSFFGVAASFASAGSWFYMYIVGRLGHIFSDLVLESQTPRQSTTCDRKIFSPFRVLIEVEVVLPRIFLFFKKASLAEVSRLQLCFHFSTVILMLYCHWNNTHAGLTIFAVIVSTAEIIWFCIFLLKLSFIIFPIVIFLWCIVLSFVLITMESY